MIITDQFEKIDLLPLQAKVWFYRKEEIPLVGYYMLRKDYYPNGNIKRKGWAFKQGGTECGLWYLFNEAGELTASVDYDARHTFTLWEVVRWALQAGISFADMSINKINVPPRWMVEHYKGKHRDYYELDGMTGEVLEK